MPLANFLPGLPQPLVETLVQIVGLLGGILLAYGVYLEAERRQDAVFVIGSACLLVYALWINNVIFIFAFGLLLAVAGRELIQIMRGKHQHTTENNQR
ncbi:MAG: hypothetical protein HYV42_05200 [Candidatus Magasanikbacteria bacterium]|nr:hypothetical protein [Candidatus Magasanikbacteria bacterium]